MANILTQNGNEFVLKGELTLASVEQLYSDSRLLFKSAVNPINIDLREVNHSDSAGVALLAAWVKFARQQGKEIYLKNIPAQMWDTIHVSGLNNILPISNHN